MLLRLFKQRELNEGKTTGGGVLSTLKVMFRERKRGGGGKGTEREEEEEKEQRERREIERVT